MTLVKSLNSGDPYVLYVLPDIERGVSVAGSTENALGSYSASIQVQFRRANYNRLRCRRMGFESRPWHVDMSVSDTLVEYGYDKFYHLHGVNFLFCLRNIVHRCERCARVLYTIVRWTFPSLIPTQHFDYIYWIATEDTHLNITKETAVCAIYVHKQIHKQMKLIYLLIPPPTPRPRNRIWIPLRKWMAFLPRKRCYPSIHLLSRASVSLLRKY